MAIIALNPIMTSMSGTAGRLVFYKRNGKTIARAWVRPANPDSEAQKANRELFRRAMASWKELSDEEKASYNTQGKRMGMTGHNLFISHRMKNRAQKIDSKPARKTVPEYTAAAHRDNEIYRRRVSRYAPTKQPSSPGFYPSVTASSSPYILSLLQRNPLSACRRGT